MKLKTTLAAMTAAATLVAAPTAAPARPMSAPITVAANSCSPRFTSARINGVHKCLRAGEFCAHKYDHRSPRPWPYIHYGYRCIKYYPNVQRYRLTHA